MQPENVNPKNFEVKNILYNNRHFSIAFGIWEDGDDHLAMRWNGENDSDLGYPIDYGKPMWFQIDDALTLPILSSLVGLDNSNKLEIISVLTRIYQE